jgi:hypothetical protein
MGWLDGEQISAGSVMLEIDSYDDHHLGDE